MGAGPGQSPAQPGPAQTLRETTKHAMGHPQVGTGVATAAQSWLNHSSFMEPVNEAASRSHQPKSALESQMQLTNSSQTEIIQNKSPLALAEIDQSPQQLEQQPVGGRQSSTREQAPPHKAGGMGLQQYVHSAETTDHPRHQGAPADKASAASTNIVSIKDARDSNYEAALSIEDSALPSCCVHGTF